MYDNLILGYCGIHKFGLYSFIVCVKRRWNTTGFVRPTALFQPSRFVGRTITQSTHKLIIILNYKTPYWLSQSWNEASKNDIISISQSYHQQFPKHTETWQYNQQRFHSVSKSNHRFVNPSSPCWCLCMSTYKYKYVYVCMSLINPSGEPSMHSIPRSKTSRSVWMNLQNETIWIFVCWTLSFNILVDTFSNIAI